jgi:hypothetical protein
MAVLTLQRATILLMQSRTMVRVALVHAAPWLLAVEHSKEKFLGSYLTQPEQWLLQAAPRSMETYALLLVVDSKW